jgi:hypothetical protein
MCDRSATDLQGHGDVGLYRLGAASGLAAVGFAVLQIAIEVVGWGIAGTPVPDTVEGWFALLQSNRLLGLTELTGFQIPMFALLIPFFLALHAALKTTRPALTLVATAVALIGIGVYLASNTALSMLSLSDQWAAATTDAQRTILVAAGQAMLAIYEGPGLNAGVLLVMLATLALSWNMLRGRPFGRPTAVLGVVAGVIGLTYYAAVALPSHRIFILEAAAPFFLTWIFLVAWRVGRLDST